MTLIVTVLTWSTIYQSADRRLTWLNKDASTQTDSSMKVTILQYPTWNGCISYTGIGASGQLETSKLVLEWLSKLYSAKPEDIIERIQTKGSEWVDRSIRAHPSFRDYPDSDRNTFVFAYFWKTRPQLAVISNCEDAFGRGACRRITHDEKHNKKAGFRPGAAGLRGRLQRSRRSSISAQSQRRRASQCHHSAQIRAMLRELTIGASMNSATRGNVSSECSTFPSEG